MTEYEEIKIKLLNDLQYYFNILHETTFEVEDFVKNKEYPLEDRWEIFIESGLGNEESFMVYFKSYDIEEYLCRHDKYETIYIQNIIDDSIDRKESLETINNLKEEILQMFIKSFEYDW